MASKLDYLIEGERRGLLQPEMQSMLDEARRRGLVPPRKSRETVGSLASATIGAGDAMTGGTVDEGLGQVAGLAKTGYDLAGTPGAVAGGMLALTPLGSTADLVASNLSPAYNQAKATVTKGMRDVRQAATEDAPFAYGAGFLGGAVTGGPSGLSAKLMGPAKRGLAGLGGRMMRNAMDAGMLAGIYGAGAADPETDATPLNALAQRGAGAATAAPIGALAGGIGTGVVETGASLAKNLVTNPAMARLAPKAFATTKVGEALVRDNPAITSVAMPGGFRTPGRLKASTAQAMQDPATMVADIGGDNTRKLMRAALNTPNDARTAFHVKLDSRAGGQSREIIREIGTKLGDPKALEADIDGLIMQRGNASRTLFDAAYRKPVVTSPEAKAKLADLLSRPLGVRLMRKAQEFAANEGKAFDKLPSTEAIHYVKMQVDKAIRAAKKGEVVGQDVWDLNSLYSFKRRLLNSVENPEYKRALQAFAGPSKLKDAAELGAKHVAATNITPHIVRKTLDRLTPGEAQMYRRGAAQALMVKLKRGGASIDRVKRDFSSPADLEKLRAVLPDRRSYLEMLRYLGIKERQAVTRRAAQGNSTTASQLKELEEGGRLPETVQDAGETAMAVASGAPMTMLAKIAQMGSRYGGMTDKVAANVLRQLGSRPGSPQFPTQGNLAPMVRQMVTAERRRNALSAASARGVAALPTQHQGRR